METVRIDKWLWAARFFKTRSLAAKAVSGGHVAVNGHKVKPARELRTGDVLIIRREQLEMTVNVQALSEHRGPAVAARTLYEETAESLDRREREREERRLQNGPGSRPETRPDKHERRKIRQFLKKE